MRQRPNEQGHERPNPRMVLFRMFFSEPHGGTSAWLQFSFFTIGSAVLTVIIGYDFMRQWGGLLLGGLAVPWCEFLAEVLPKKQWKLAGMIRMAGWIILIGVLLVHLARIATFQ